MNTNDKIDRAKLRLQRLGDRLASRGMAGIVMLGLAAGGLLGAVLGVALTGLTNLR